MAIKRKKNAAIVIDAEGQRLVVLEKSQNEMDDMSSVLAVPEAVYDENRSIQDYSFEDLYQFQGGDFQVVDTTNEAFASKVGKGGGFQAGDQIYNYGNPKGFATVIGEETASPFGQMAFGEIQQEVEFEDGSTGYLNPSSAVLAEDFNNSYHVVDDAGNIVAGGPPLNREQVYELVDSGRVKELLGTDSEYYVVKGLREDPREMEPVASKSSRVKKRAKYSVDNPPSQVSHLSSTEQRKWVHIVNSALDDGDDEESAFKQAWGQVNDSEKKNKGGTIRRKPMRIKKKAIDYDEERESYQESKDNLPSSNPSDPTKQQTPTSTPSGQDDEKRNNLYMKAVEEYGEVDDLAFDEAVQKAEEAAGQQSAYPTEDEIWPHIEFFMNGGSREAMMRYAAALGTSSLKCPKCSSKKLGRMENPNYLRCENNHKMRLHLDYTGNSSLKNAANRLKNRYNLSDKQATEMARTVMAEAWEREWREQNGEGQFVEGDTVVFNDTSPINTGMVGVVQSVEQVDLGPTGEETRVNVLTHNGYSEQLVSVKPDSLDIQTQEEGAQKQAEGLEEMEAEVETSFANDLDESTKLGLNTLIYDNADNPFYMLGAIDGYLGTNDFYRLALTQEERMQHEDGKRNGEQYSNE